MRVGILTGGGDCPGLNAVVRAVAKALHRKDCQVWGIADGFLGLVKNDLRLLDDPSVSGILQRGGTILGTSNRDDPFDFDGVVDGERLRGDLSARVMAIVEDRRLDAVVVVGGDGTQTIAWRLAGLGLPVVGVPKTIDNDLSATDMTFGFDSARQVTCEAVDRLHTTADSHHRIMFVETMGRNSGFIALHGGMAGGADVVLMPEIPFTLEPVVTFLQGRIDRGKRASLVVVAEGAVEAGGDSVRRPDGRLGGVAAGLAGRVEESLGVECRVTVLGHLQRGGSPTAYDRILGTRFGVLAAELTARRAFGQMVALRGTEVVGVPLEEAIAQVRRVDPQGQFVAAARAVGTCFGGS
jgi:6-phosphofructokinase 1